LGKKFSPDIGVPEEFAQEYRQRFDETNSRLIADFFDPPETRFNFKTFSGPSEGMAPMDLIEKVLAVFSDIAPGRARLLQSYLPKYISEDAIPTLLPK